MGLTKNLGALPKVLTVSGSNIGLGTTNASVKITVRASDAPTLPTLGTASGHFLIGNGATNVDYGLMFGVNGDGDTWIQSQRVDGTATAYNTLLQPRGGNVGIGNISPLAKLVVGTSSDVNFEVRNGADYGLTGVGIDSRDNARSVRNAMFVYGSPIILGGGNVGIGTTSTSAKLTVSDTNTVTNQIDLVGYGSTAKGHIGEFANNLYISSNYFYNGTQNADTSSLGQSAIVLSAGTTTTSFIDFNLSDAGATSPANKVRILSNGNVGIGTATPTSKLQVGNITGGGTGVAAPTCLTLDDTFGIGTIGTNFKLKIFQDNATNKYGFGVSDSLFEVIAGSGGSIGFFTNQTNQSMRISSNGVITTPYQPAFRAWYSINATWTLASNAVFNFNVTEYNIGNCFNTSNGTFTAPVAGVYQFNFYTIVLSTYTNGAISFRKNGGVATSGYNVHFSPTAADAWSNVVYTTSMYLNQGDYVNMVNAGGFSTNFHGKDWSSFSGYLVG